MPRKKNKSKVMEAPVVVIGNNPIIDLQNLVKKLYYHNKVKEAKFETYATFITLVTLPDGKQFESIGKTPKISKQNAADKVLKYLNSMKQVVKDNRNSAKAKGIVIDDEE